MKDLKLEDCIHEHGFPANLDKNFMIVVQVMPRPEQSIILYTSYIYRKISRSYFPFSFSDKYKDGIYIFTKE